MFFKAHKLPEPEEIRRPDEVAYETSVCTGEKLIGFRSGRTGKLEKAVVVRSRKDIDDFYRKYGIVR